MGGAPLSATVVKAGAASATSYAGHSRPWMQVWPRRCKRGPFGQHKCLDVQCGAYHTFARVEMETPLDEEVNASPVVLRPVEIALTSVYVDGSDEKLVEALVQQGKAGGSPLQRETKRTVELSK